MKPGLAACVVVKLHWTAVARGTFIPHLSIKRSYIALLVAILGTTISPYPFFWQSMHRLEEMRDEPEGGNEPEQLSDRSDPAAKTKERTSRFDVFSGMAFSNVVMFAIIVTTAATLGSHGKHNIQSAAGAASALKPVAGRFASTLFALGFIGAGMLAIPVLAGSGSAGMAGLLA
jgi:Mn2+/Fe2+ NRAMP family transporter